MAPVDLLLILAVVSVATSQSLNVTGIYTNTTSTVNITSSTTSLAPFDTSSSITPTSGIASSASLLSTPSPAGSTSATNGNTESTSSTTSSAQELGAYILQALGASLASLSTLPINGTTSTSLTRHQPFTQSSVTSAASTSSYTGLSSSPVSASGPYNATTLGSGDNATTMSKTFYGSSLVSVGLQTSPATTNGSTRYITLKHASGTQHNLTAASQQTYGSSLVSVGLQTTSAASNDSTRYITLKRFSSTATGVTATSRSNTTMTSAPYALSNATTSTAAANISTTFLNSSIAATGSGSAYAKQCQALWTEWLGSSDALPSYLTTGTTYYTVTNWTASTTTLGGCDDMPRLVGTFTPTATSVTSFTSANFVTNGTLGPTPTCSINPSDCENMFVSQSSAQSAQASLVRAALTSYILATSATAMTVINGDTTSITTFSAAQMTPAPIITIDGSEFSPSVHTYTYSVPLTSTLTETAYYSDGEFFMDEQNYGWSYTDPPPLPDWAYFTPKCNRTLNSTSCGACTIYGGQVELMYFPTTANATRSTCIGYPSPPTTCPLGPTTAPYVPATPNTIDGQCASYVNCPYLYGNTSTTDSGPYTVSGGQTLYANRAYISLQTAYAANSCGYVGKQHAGSIVTMESSQIYSIFHVQPSHPGCVDYGYSFDFANLLPNLPWYAWNTEMFNTGCLGITASGYPNAGGNYINGKPVGTDLCSTIVDWAYFPTLVVPTQIRALDPAWATCAIALEGLYDPPKALTVQTTVDGASGPGVQTTTPASPASTINGNPTPTGIASTAVATTQPAQAGSSAIGDPAASTSKSSQQAVSSAKSGTGDTGGSTVNAGSAPSSGVNLSAAISILSQALSSAAANSAGNNGGGSGSTGSGGNDANGDPAGTAASQGSGVGGVAAPQGAGSNAGSSANRGAASSQGTGANSGSGSGSDPGSKAGSSAASDPSTVLVGSSAFTVVPTILPGGSSGVVVANGGTAATLAAGQTTSIGGQVASADSTGVVIGSGDAAATVAPFASAGSGSSAAQSSGAVISVGSSSDITAVQIVITGSNGQATTQAVIGGSTITQGGAAATINGQTLSLAANGVVVGSSTQPISGLPAASALGAVVQVDSSSLTVVQSIVTGSNGKLTTEAIVGGTTITQGGAAATINGHVVSLGSSGLVVGGSSTQAVAALATSAAPSGAVLTIGTALVTASQTVVTGSDGQRTTEAVVAGTTLIQGGSAAVIGGHTVSLGSNGFVVDGSQTASISALNGGSAITGAIITLGSSTLTASQTVITGADGKLTTEAIVAGRALIAGNAAVTIDGHMLSLGSSVVIVDGKQTATISLISPLVTGALVILGSSRLTASQTVMTGANGQRTTEIVIGGSTLVSGGAPLTISGHTLTYGSNGVVVDGTQTDPVSTVAARMTTTPVVFTEHGQVFTATPVPGRPGLYVVEGQTISIGGPQVTVDGLTLTAQSSGVVVDGTQTVSFSGSGGLPARLTAASGPSMPPAGPLATASSTKKSNAESVIVEKMFGLLLSVSLVAMILM